MKKILKTAASLKIKKYRDREKIFAAEGVRLVETALAANAPIRFAVNAADNENERRQNLVAALQRKNIPVYDVTAEEFAKISATKTPQGIMAVIETKSSDLTEFADAKLLVVLDEVRDPGNLGAIIRSADAFAADGVIALKNSVDVFADKTVRSTMGSIFHVPIAVNVSRDEFLSFAAANGFTAFLSLPDKNAKPVFAADMRGKCALVMGSEAFGVTKELAAEMPARGVPYEKIYIPMQGRAESLNVASAAAILLYECRRQGNGAT